MNTQLSHITKNSKRTMAYRNRLHTQGVKRIEIRVSSQDVILIHNIARILRADGDEATSLREQIQKVTGGGVGTSTGKDLVAFLRHSPLAEAVLNLERDKTTSRTVIFE